jgi:hypothetical protein
MDIKRKLEIASQSVDSIGTHVDEDAQVITAALKAIKASCDKYIAEAGKRGRARVARIKPAPAPHKKVPAKKVTRK